MNRTRSSELAPPAIAWPRLLIRPELQPDSVHVWAVNLGRHPDSVRACETCLSPEEQGRAAELRLPDVRRRFVVARAALRNLLAGYLGESPERLEFSYAVRGKPGLAGAAGQRIQFNLAHSADLALIAVTKRVPVGVDVEAVRVMPDAELIAARFFAPREAETLGKVKVEERAAAFFRLWTRKEAWLKATGDGIAESLARFEVSFLPEEPCRLITIDGNADPAQDWRLCHLSPAPGFVGAVAVRLQSVRLELHEFRIEPRQSPD